MVLDSALADALYLNWRVPLSALPPAPGGLRYDRAAGDPDDEAATLFSLLFFRHHGIHWRGARWLALSYPQVNARLAVRDGANEAGALLLRQLVPGWVVPVGRLLYGQPCSAAVCDFPGGGSPERWARAATEAGEREWRWRVSAGAQVAVRATLGPDGSKCAPGTRAWEEEVAFVRERSRIYWTAGTVVRQVDLESPRSPSNPVAPVLPVRAHLERTDWLETFLPFAPSGGWAAVHSAFLVPRVQVSFAFDAARERPVAAPMAAAG